MSKVVDPYSEEGSERKKEEALLKLRELTSTIAKDEPFPERVITFVTDNWMIFDHPEDTHRSCFEDTLNKLPTGGGRSPTFRSK
jgi:hypothetical protein